ncbi:MAG: DUF4942 domain-containing protein [Saccharospirillaceae bacterium]|nr:DUF4942 domain-containing protein [Saccharospirillaceae bacterium]
MACATTSTPIHIDVIRDMVIAHDREVKYINKVAEFNALPEHRGALADLLREKNVILFNDAELFKPEAALLSVRRSYWKKLSTKSKIADLMGSAQKKEFNEQMRTGDGLPEFTIGHINSSLSELYGQGRQFFINSVDEVFQKLSKDHVTNCPAGFKKKMIMADERETWGHISRSIMNLTHDLRRIIARFSGRGSEDLSFEQTKYVFSHADCDTGTYVDVDNAFRLKTFKNGNCHVEINDEISHQLNEILAEKYPTAIPAPKRKSQSSRKKTAKKQVFIDKLLSFNVLQSLTKMVENERYASLSKISYDRIQSGAGNNKFMAAQIVDVLTLLGAVKIGRFYQFDETRRGVIAAMLKSVIANGYVPDYRSQQYYPSGDTVASAAVACAKIDKPGLSCIEPNAGQGGISQYLPFDTVNVEINPLFCEFLTAKGLENVVCDDFLKYSANTTAKYDRVVMNPPFTDNAWLFHVKAALTLLNNDGVLVAILPVSAEQKLTLSEQYLVEFLETFDNEFANTQISVIIVRITIK